MLHAATPWVPKTGFDRSCRWSAVDAALECRSRCRPHLLVDKRFRCGLRRSLSKGRGILDVARDDAGRDVEGRGLLGFGRDADLIDPYGPGAVARLAAQYGRSRVGAASGSSRRAAYFQIDLPLPGRPRVLHISSTLDITSSDIRISVPHSRLVSGGHLLVASRPIFEPSPSSGLAKSR